MIIRPIEVSDVPGVAEIYLETVQKAYKQLVATHLLPSESSRGDLIEFYASFVGNDTTIFVADNGEGICGFCRLKERPKKTCEIAQLYIIPDIQGKGVGRKFISHLDDLGKYRKLRLLVIEGNKPAIDFYHKVGFIPTGEKKFLPQFGVQELELERHVKEGQK